MNISEATAWQRVAEVLRGNVDLDDDVTRDKVAHDCAVLDVRAHAAMKAGTKTDDETWSELLCNVAFLEPEVTK